MYKQFYSSVSFQKIFKTNIFIVKTDANYAKINDVGSLKVSFQYVLLFTMSEIFTVLLRNIIS